MLHVNTRSNAGAAKTRASCFITGSKHLTQMKARGRRPSGFISISVLGTLDEALALVFNVYHQASKPGTNERKQLKTKLETFLV